MNRPERTLPEGDSGKNGAADILEAQELRTELFRIVKCQMLLAVAAVRGIVIRKAHHLPEDNALAADTDIFRMQRIQTRPRLGIRRNIIRQRIIRRIQRSDQHSSRVQAKHDIAFQPQRTEQIPTRRNKDKTAALIGAAVNGILKRLGIERAPVCTGAVIHDVEVYRIFHFSIRSRVKSLNWNSFS